MTGTTATGVSPWRGHDLGARTVTWTERDAILYALAVGARADALDLVHEERLRVLPTFALTLAQWAPDALGALGAFDPATAVHGAQRLLVRDELAPSGTMETRARVSEVWDKGGAAVFEVEVSCPAFVATWSLFAPGSGGFGGERGPSAPPRAPDTADRVLTLATHSRQAALYRLLGDRHAMHVDPEAARAAGMPRPFLHGLCTLAAATLPLAESLGAHPAGLRELEARFAAPVFPGDRLTLRCRDDAPGAPGVRFEAVTEDDEGHARTVLSGARARFGPPASPAPPRSSERPNREETTHA